MNQIQAKMGNIISIGVESLTIWLFHIILSTEYESFMKIWNLEFTGSKLTIFRSKLLVSQKRWIYKEKIVASCVWTKSFSANVPRPLSKVLTWAIWILPSQDFNKGPKYIREKWSCLSLYLGIHYIQFRPKFNHVWPKYGWFWTCKVQTLNFH